MLLRKRILTFFLFITVWANAQQKINGLVEDDVTGAPVSFASVTAEKGEGMITDSIGNFHFVINKKLKLNDSLLISAIGYSPKKIAVKDLLINKKIPLTHYDQMLEQVKVYASLKGDPLQFGYYREFGFDTSTWVEKIDSVKYKSNDRYRWNTINKKDSRIKKNTRANGEIGFIFELPTRKIQVGKVQVKINHNYDTCWLKLHMRDVDATGLGLPENDLLKSNIILPVTLKYGLVEFDLDWRNITVPTNQVYVGFELQRCGCSASDAPSFFFMGNEKGVNFYRENEKAIWKRGVDYTIYVRMITK